jgi:hypothetical protein
MDAVKKVLRKIRQVHAPAIVYPKPKPRWLKDIELRRENQVRWEMDKKINRDHAFEKAKIGLAKYRKEQRLEKERQAELAEQRLKNLRKARRVLARKREGDET